MSKAHGACWVLATLAVSSCGCGGTARDPNLVDVSGIITYNGSAVEGAMVTFLPQDASKTAAYGRTDAEGRFQLQTSGANDGAHPGEYRVTILKQEIGAMKDDPEFEDVYDPGILAPPKYLVPKKYGTAKTSGLSASVVANDAVELMFELKD